MWIESKTPEGNRVTFNSDKVINILEKEEGCAIMFSEYDIAIPFGESYESVKKKLQAAELKVSVDPHTGEELRQREAFFRGK